MAFAHRNADVGIAAIGVHVDLNAEVDGGDDEQCRGSHNYCAGAEAKCLTFTGRLEKRTYAVQQNSVTRSSRRLILAA